MTYLALTMYKLFLGNCGRPLLTVTAEGNGDIPNVYQAPEKHDILKYFFPQLYIKL